MDNRNLENGVRKFSMRLNSDEMEMIEYGAERAGKDKTAYVKALISSDVSKRRRREERRNAKTQFVAEDSVGHEGHSGRRAG